LEAVALSQIEGQLHHCVSDAIDAGEPGASDMIAEAAEAERRLVRS
jgi:DNA-binding FrmR family transcriptional regulator